MSKNKRLSDLLFSGTPKHKIKDYAKVNEIFRSYVVEHYFAMAKEIYWYREFEFFYDLGIFLNMNFKSDHFKSFVYRDILEQYEEHWIEVIENNALKKLKKKWRI